MEIITRGEAIEKKLRFYFTGEPCKRGHISKRYTSNHTCCECKRLWFQDNKERITSKRKKFYQENKEVFAEYNRKYREENKEFIKKMKKEYAINNRDKTNKNARDRYSNDTDFRLKCLCYQLLSRVLSSTLKEKRGRTYEILGYTNKELRCNLEDKFLEGMSWKNYPLWHVDHQYPVTRYIQNGETRPDVINSLDNLIPMWQEHNLAKRDKTLEEFLTDRPELFNLYGHFLETSTTKDSK